VLISNWCAPYHDTNRHSVECVICHDPTTQAFQAACGCFYDRECLTELFEKVTVDESLFPPRCCNRPISFDQVRTIFGPSLIQEFEKKAEEFRTPNRLYCHNPLCSSFIGPAVASQREKTNKRCTRCSQTTCSFCKGPAHASFSSCPTDLAAQELLELGRQEGWQSCPSCHQMVELDTGCYHMTCRCRHQFCYLCAQQWKSCTCPHWDETLLLAHANRQVVREHGALPANARQVQVVTRQQEVRKVADSLRENHQCAHHRVGFIRQNHGGTCESCGKQSRNMILVRY
jgi:hypothetical protein